jgi:hypothetical protein
MVESSSAILLQLLKSQIIDGVKITLTSEKTDVVDKINKNQFMKVEEIIWNRFSRI